MNKFEECRNTIKEALDRLAECADNPDDFTSIEVTDELVYSIFGDDLDVENEVEDIMWMFMMEL